jgi:hypothetical protein
MTLIAQKRSLNMREVLCHSLGPIPWEIANCDGSLKKTNKAALSTQLFKIGNIVEVIPDKSAVIIDGMALVQKVPGSLNSFGSIADHIFKMALNEGRSCIRIDIVFDVYRTISIKSPERHLRGQQEGLNYVNLTSGQKVLQWQKFLIYKK